MKLTFIESGGFAGRIRRFELDTDTMPADQAAQLCDLVAHARKHLTATAANTTSRDSLTFEWQIDDNGCRDSWLVGELEMPQDAWPLLEFCQQLAVYT